LVGGKSSASVVEGRCRGEKVEENELIERKGVEKAPILRHQGRKRLKYRAVTWQLYRIFRHYTFYQKFRAHSF
jgi:hypothetical protein